jgi:hypothetical protein
MSTTTDPTTPVSEADAAALARHAGLPIPAERLPRFAAELTNAQGLIHDLDAVPVDAQAPNVPGFDPAWTTRTGATGR